MIIIYSKTNGEVWKAVDRTDIDSEGILWGFIGEGKVGYHPNCNPASYELTDSQNKNYNPNKLYNFNGTELIERESGIVEADLIEE